MPEMYLPPKMRVIKLYQGLNFDRDKPCVVRIRRHRTHHRCAYHDVMLVQWDFKERK